MPSFARRLRARLPAAALALFALHLAGCDPRLPGDSDAPGTPRLDPGIATMADGTRLPLSHWQAGTDTPRAVVLAVHGFNDYRLGWSVLGEALAARGVSLYAFDQRGFGATAQRGTWPGTQRLVADVVTLVRLLEARYPETPLFLAGESMGGAVALLAHARTPDLPVRGAVLLAPAVWNRGNMPWYQRAGLWVASLVAPDRRLTGSGLAIRPSDNREMLRALGRDPLIQRGARVEALNGLTDLMDAAQAAARSYRGPALILYGENDEVIPPTPVCQMLRRLPDEARWRAALYPEGYHMLTRDLAGHVVRRDIGDWLLDPGGSLSSGAEATLSGRLGAFCNDSV